MMMTSTALTRSPEEQKKLDELYRSKFNSPEWAYFREVVCLRRPYTTADFNREYFIPD